MSYNKTRWVNRSTKVNEDNMNKIEEGIFEAHKQLDQISVTIVERIKQEVKDIVDEELIKQIIEEEIEKAINKIDSISRYGSPLPIDANKNVDITEFAITDETIDGTIARHYKTKDNKKIIVDHAVMDNQGRNIADNIDEIYSNKKVQIINLNGVDLFFKRGTNKIPNIFNQITNSQADIFIFSNFKFCDFKIDKVVAKTTVTLDDSSLYYNFTFMSLFYGTDSYLVEIDCDQSNIYIDFEFMPKEADVKYDIDTALEKYEFEDINVISKNCRNLLEG